MPEHLRAIWPFVGLLFLLVVWFDYRSAKRRGLKGHWSDRANNPPGFLLACGITLGLLAIWVYGMALMLLGG